MFGTHVRRDQLGPRDSDNLTTVTRMRGLE